MAFTLPDGTPLNLIQHGLGNNLVGYALQRGYGGSLDAQGGDIGQLSSYLGYSPEQLDEVASMIRGSPNGNRESMLSVKLSEQARDKQVLDWLTSQGYQASGVDTGQEWIQQLLDPSGGLVATDAYNYNNTTKGVNRLGMVGALLVGGAAALGGAGGAGGAGAAGAAGSTGTGTLGAGASGAGSAGLTASLPSSAELLGGLTSSSSLFNPIALAPSLGAGAGITAGIGAADMGGLSSAGLEASGWAAPISGAQSSAGLGSFGTLGAGAGAPSVTTPGISAADTAGIGLSNTAPLTGVPSTVGGGGLLGSIANSGVGQAVGQVADLVGGGQNLAGIVGGLLGATQGGGSDTSTRQTRTDPRFDPYLYGDNGFLSQLQQQFNATKSGTNADITAGQNMLRDLYTSPAYTQGYQDMRSAGQGLLGRSIAGNPFTMASPPQFGRNSPAMQQSPENPFMGMFAQTQTMPQRGLLNPFGG